MQHLRIRPIREEVQIPLSPPDPISPSRLSQSALADQTVFVTGAAGFIGSHLVRRLHEAGARVIALSRDGKLRDDLTDVDIEIVQGDIGDSAAMESIIARKIDIVFHLAAWLRGGSGREATSTNVHATRRLGELSARYGVRRFIYTSSIAVYGPHGDRNVDESSPLRPYKDPYGDSKILAESVVKDIAAQKGLAYVIIRPGMVYGPGSPGWTRRLAVWALQGRMPLVDGGRASAYPVYIDNLVDLYLLAATHPAAIGQTFNGVDDGPITLGEFAGAYMRMIPTEKAIRVPGWLVSALAGLIDPLIPGLNCKYIVNQMRGRGQVLNTKAKEILGWTPQVNLEEGMRRSEEWLRTEGILK